jgi:hypothetical protein
VWTNTERYGSGKKTGDWLDLVWGKKIRETQTVMVESRLQG